ncbi:MAG: hypothetical protein HDS36_04825 [Bacteroides sp.]|nr:hypothetical protein [Bacteroides sp.]
MKIVILWRIKIKGIRGNKGIKGIKGTKGDKGIKEEKFFIHGNIQQEI